MKGFYISPGNPACKRLEANQKCICIFRATPSVAGNIILHDYKLFYFSHGPLLLSFILSICPAEQFRPVTRFRPVFPIRPVLQDCPDCLVLSGCLVPCQIDTRLLPLLLCAIVSVTQYEFPHPRSVHAHEP